MLPSFLFPIAEATTVLRDVYVSVPGGPGNSIHGDSWQSWKPSWSAELLTISIYFMSLRSDVTLKIVSGQGNGGSVLHSQQSFAVSRTDGWKNLTLSTPLAVTKGTVYSFVFDCSCGSPRDESNPYSGGVSGRYTVTDRYDDYPFMTYMLEPSNPCEHNNGDCPAAATCVHTGLRTHICTCETAGYGGPDCSPINYCNFSNPSRCEEICVYTGPGTYRCECPSNEWGINGTECKPHSLCTAGDYVTQAPTSTSDRGCAPCPAGHQCSAGGAPEACPAPDTYAAARSTECSPVPSGFYSLPETGPRTQVVICPPGFYCSGAVKEPCPSG